MPKSKNEKAIEAEQLYRKGLKLVEIARQLDVPSGTVRRWKSNYKWDAQSERSDKNKANARKKGGQIGNRGNRQAQGPPKGSQNALKHGLFAKYLPQEVFGIAEELEEKSPIDILWENITLTYANLLHAQRILFVRDKEDNNTFISSDGESGTSYEHHTAWDKQEKAFSAIARLQGELRQMIKTYDELTRSPLVTDEQRLRIEKLKQQVAGDEEQEDKLLQFARALNERFGDD